MNTVDLISNAAENNPVYSLFNNKEVLTFLEGLEIEKTLWKDDIESERSLRLATKSPKESDDLIHSFKLDPKSFPVKFKEAIGGDGQEYRRIRTLHSSSLISLLCFYNGFVFGCIIQFIHRIFVTVFQKPVDDLFTNLNRPSVFHKLDNLILN